MDLSFMGISTDGAENAVKNLVIIRGNVHFPHSESKGVACI